jgi:hypothetical protein
MIHHHAIEQRLVAILQAGELDVAFEVAGLACTCSSIVWTCGGSSPRRPKASRSASVKAVPLLKTGLCSQSTPLEGSARAARLVLDV